MCRLSRSRALFPSPEARFMMELPAPSVDNKSLCLLPIPFTSNFLSPAPLSSQCSFLTISLSLHSFVSSRGGGGELWRVQSPGRGPEEHWGWQLLVHEQTAGRHPGKHAHSFVWEIAGSVFRCFKSFGHFHKANRTHFQPRTHQRAVQDE